MDLAFADRKRLAEDGRSFSCKGCPERTQELRRCWEDRWDFTSKDNPAVFPIYVHKGGELYGFCPGKALREPEVQRLFGLLMIAADTGVMLVPGGIADQPEWFVDMLAWLIPKLDMARFTSKAAMVLGGNTNKSQHKAFTERVLAAEKAGAHGGDNRLSPR